MAAKYVRIEMKSIWWFRIMCFKDILVVEHGNRSDEPTRKASLEMILGNADVWGKSTNHISHSWWIGIDSASSGIHLWPVYL
jgi:hypothetical protein